MLSSKVRLSRRFWAALLMALLLAVGGTMESRSDGGYARSAAARASLSAGIGAAAPPEEQPGQPDDPAQTAAASASASSSDTVIERLSKLKSRQELIEKNKQFPMLHADPSQFLETVEVVATGYYAGVESTGKRPGHPQYGITYSGVKVQQGVLSTIAADPKVFPLGTILYIPGYGYGIVADTGSAIKGFKIDLYYKTKDQIYKEWGKKTVNVFVVKRGEGRVREETLQQWNDIWSEVSTRKVSSIAL